MQNCTISPRAAERKRQKRIVIIANQERLAYDNLGSLEVGTMRNLRAGILGLAIGMLPLATIRAGAAVVNAADCTTGTTAAMFRD